MKKFLLKSQRPKHHIECGEFIVDFYFRDGSIKDTYMEIRTTSNVMTLRLDGRTYTYMYLYTAAEKGDVDQIHGYCLRMFEFGMLMCQDQGMLDDHDRAMNKYYKRLEKRGEKQAAAVTEEQNLADTYLMESAIERGALKGRAAKQAEKESREAIKEVLKNEAEDGNDDGE